MDYYLSCGHQQVRLVGADPWIIGRKHIIQRLLSDECDLSQPIRHDIEIEKKCWFSTNTDMGKETFGGTWL